MFLRSPLGADDLMEGLEAWGPGSCTGLPGVHIGGQDAEKCGCRSANDKCWLVLWNMNGFWLSIYWECHHPNWRTHIFQRGRYTTNQNIISHHQPYNNHILTITNSMFHLNRTMCMMTTRQFWEMIFAPLDSSSKAFLDHNHRCKI